MATELRVEMCAMWQRAPVSSASSRSRATITSSEAAGMPRKPQPHRLRALVHIAARAEAQVLAVVDHRQVVGARELHGAAHDARVHHRLAIVGNGHRAGGLHGADGRQLLARAALGDGPDGKHVDHGVLRARSTM